MELFEDINVMVYKGSAIAFQSIWQNFRSEYNVCDAG